MLILISNLPYFVRLFSGPSLRTSSELRRPPGATIAATTVLISTASVSVSASEKAYLLLVRNDASIHRIARTPTTKLFIHVHIYLFPTTGVRPPSSRTHSHQAVTDVSLICVTRALHLIHNPALRPSKFLIQQHDHQPPVSLPASFPFLILYTVSMVGSSKGIQKQHPSDRGSH